MRTKNLLPLLAAALLFLFLAVRTGAEIYFNGLSFDGAMNAQVPLNLVLAGEYKPLYSGIEDYPHRIQTGPTVLLPIAVFFSLFGTSEFVAQIPNLLYLWGTAILLFALLWRHASPWAANLALLLFALTPQLLDLGLRGYGEVPATFFAVLAAWALGREPRNLGSPLLAGLAVGAAIVTKTQMLLLLPCLAVAFAAEGLLWQRRPWKHYVTTASGVAIVVGLFEVIKLVILGGLDAYMGWWGLQRFYVMRQAGLGSRLPDTPDRIEKFWGHLQLLAHHIRLSTPSALLFATLPALAAGVTLREGRRTGSRSLVGILFLAIAAGAFLVWWLGFTPTAKAWLRRILVAVLLCQLLLAWLLHRAFAGLLEAVRVFRAAHRQNLPGATLLAGLIVGLIAWPTAALLDDAVTKVRIKTSQSPMKLEVQEAALRLDSLGPEVKIFGVSDWYRAPLAGFHLERSFYDLSKVPPEAQAGLQGYLVVDSYTPKLLVDAILTRADYETFYAGNHIQVYQLKGLSPWPEIDPDVREPIRNEVDFTTEAYAHTAGLYPREGNGTRWAQPYSAVRLDCSDANEILLQLFFLDPQQYSNSEITLTIILDDHARWRFRIENGGPWQLRRSLPRPLRRKPEPLTLRMALDGKVTAAGPDTRTLGFVLREVACL